MRLMKLILMFTLMMPALSRADTNSYLIETFNWPVHGEFIALSKWPVGADLYEQGIKLAGQSGTDLSTYYQLIKKSADLGNPDALYWLGAYYLNDQMSDKTRVEECFSKAVSIYQTKADEGSPLYSYILGCLLYQLHYPNTKDDWETEYQLFKKAALGGNLDAIIRLEQISQVQFSFRDDGKPYDYLADSESGIGQLQFINASRYSAIKIHPEEKEKWLELAANSGVYEAQMYLGDNSAKDSLDQEKWYLLASKNAKDDGHALNNLGEFYTRANDQAKEIEYYTKSAALGDGLYSKIAKQTLAKIEADHKNKEQEEVQTKSEQAQLKKLKADGLAGDVESLLKLGDMYRKSDPIKSEMWYGLASIKGSDVGAFKLGLIYSGNNLKKSLEFLKLAANRNNYDAMCLLAQVYESGCLGSIDMETAEYYYKQAKAIGPKDVPNFDQQLNSATLIKKAILNATNDNNEIDQVELGKTYDPYLNDYDTMLVISLKDTGFFVGDDVFVQGVGNVLPIQIQESIRFYEMAAKQGNAEAANRVKVLKSVQWKKVLSSGTN